jgi:ABC-type transport system involved in multi-copper enzyme maturation permease subunit
MTLDKILIISKTTFKEIWKSKILINVFFIGLAMMVVTFVATEFTYGVPERVALDFGLGMLSLSSIGISLFLGVGLLSKEIDSRTVYMVISRPVPRYSFILGKILGLMGIQIVNVFILSLMTVSATLLLGGQISELLIWAIIFTLIESLMLLLVVVLISLLANTVLSVLLSVVLLLLGHIIRETQEISFVANNPILVKILDFYHFILPAFYKLNLKSEVIYKSQISSSYIVMSGGYGVLYSLFLLLMIVYFFNKKNLD